MADLPRRKHTRLEGFDYSQSGYYFITLCTYDNLPILSEIKVGRGLAPAEVELTQIGRIVEDQLLKLTERYENIKIDKYVIMPTHIHVIFVLQHEAAGASPRPTLSDIICTFKSLSTRLSNKLIGAQGRKVWQTSFYDEIIRNDSAYRDIWQYIDDNPRKWNDDEYYRADKSV